jgi:nucleoside-diphosphate-sugar epimerase
MRVLVTGGHGFLGAHIARRLLTQEVQPRLFDLGAGRTVASAILGSCMRDVEAVTGDICDLDAVGVALAGCDGVIHAAAIHGPQCAADPPQAVRVNVLGTANVFQAARAAGIGQVIYASSAAVHGERYDPHPAPVSHYGASKLACEAVAAAFWHGDGLPSVGIRPFAIYGPGREHSKGYSVGITLACKAAALGEDYTIPFTGHAGFVHVDEVAAAFCEGLFLPPSGARVFELPGEQATVEGVIAAVRASVPGACVRCEGPALRVATGIPDRATYDAFPTLRPISLAEGVGATIRHYRAQGRRRQNDPA